MANFDIKTFLNQRITAVDPSIDTSDMSQTSEIMSRTLASFLAGLEEMIQQDDVVRDLRKASQMTFDQVAAIAANWGVDPKSGSRSVGTVNIFYRTPQDASITIGQAFTASNGTRFFASAPVSITSAQLSAQFDATQGGYRLDVPGITSTGAGPEFSVAAGSISAMDSQTENVLLVTNLADFSQSVAAETGQQLADRIISSASMHNYCSADSTKAVLLADPRITAVSVIGAGDIEMIRDILFGGLHTNGMQDTYIYPAAPLKTYIADQPIRPDFLPSFFFYGHDVTAGRYDPAIPIGDNAGPIVGVRKVEYGTGSGSGFIPFGVLSAGEDFVYEFIAPGIAATKNSSEEVWRLHLIKRPPAPATSVRITALRNPLPSILQAELATSGNRAPAQGTMFKAFTLALLDVSAIVKPLPGASTDSATYANAISDLIQRTPIAGAVDVSDIIDALVVAGADDVVLPVVAVANIFYPDLVTATIQITNTVGSPSIERGAFTARTIALYPGNISVVVR